MGATNFFWGNFVCLREKTTSRKTSQLWNMSANSDSTHCVDPYVVPEKENRPSLFSDYKKWVKYAKLRMRNTGMTAAR